jgi:eukaryotic-like serine/threonine-protein kinase
LASSGLAKEGDAIPVAVGDVLAGKYRVERVLGVGGMGVVVAARHLELNELRAIKFLLPEARRNPEALERFVREARAVVRLKNPHVVRIHDVGRFDGGEPYIVMEHLEGEDLKSILDRGEPLAPGPAVDIVLQALEAMAEAHAAGIIHRDLKPANLFLARADDDALLVKVLDFGISKLIESNDEGMEMTTTHALMGSPYYMSPEQMMSTRDVDARTDIWSIGVVLYQLLTGRVPFRGRNIAAQCALLLQRDPPPPSKHAPHLSPELDRAVLKFLSREPGDRYANVEVAAEALVPFAGEGGDKALARIRRLLSKGTSTSRASHPGPRTSPPSLDEDDVDDEALTRSADRRGMRIAEIAASSGRTGPDGMSQSTRAAWNTLPERPASPLSRNVLLGGAVAALLLGGAAALMLRSGGEAPPLPAAQATAEPTPSAPAPPAASAVEPASAASERVAAAPTTPSASTKAVAKSVPRAAPRPSSKPPEKTAPQPPTTSEDPFGDKRQ